MGGRREGGSGSAQEQSSVTTSLFVRFVIVGRDLMLVAFSIFPVTFSGIQKELLDS